MKTSELLAIVADLAAGDVNLQAAAVSKLEALPVGYLEDRPLSKKKVAPYLPRIASLMHSNCANPIKEWCAQIIGESGVLSDENFTALFTTLTSDNADVLKTAIWAIAAYGKKASPAIEKLFELTSHPDPQVRWRAVSTLVDIVPQGTESAERFAGLLDDSERLVRGYAVIGFVKTATPSPWAIEQLTRAAKDEDEMPRLHAEQAIRRWGIQTQETD